MSRKLADHFIIPAAPAAASAKLRNRDLEDGSRIIRHAPHQRGIKQDFKIRCLRRLHALRDLTQIGHYFFLQYAGKLIRQVGQAVRRILHACEQAQITVNVLLRQTNFRQFPGHAFQADLIHFIENDEHRIITLLWETAVSRHCFEDSPFIDADLEIMEAKPAQRSGGGQDQFNFCQIGRLSENINVALHELAVSAALRSLRPPHISHLQRLKRRWKLAGIIGIKPHERNRQVITETAIHQIRFFFGGIQVQLFSPF